MENKLPRNNNIICIRDWQLKIKVSQGERGSVRMCTTRTLSPITYFCGSCGTFWNEFNYNFARILIQDFRDKNLLMALVRARKRYFSFFSASLGT